jgi:UDP-2-acetamido-2,6-beta-L-arabino-hexul-4-ose reductase
MTRFKPYQRQEDARGHFLGLTQETWSEVNLVTTRPGAVRGNHFHKHTREMFCVLSGTVRVDIEDLRTAQRTSFDANAGELFIVEPFELHTLSAHTGSTWLNFLSQPFDPAAPDFHHREAVPATEEESA